MKVFGIIDKIRIYLIYYIEALFASSEDSQEIDEQIDEIEIE